jgi:hypothetical protein
VSNLPVALDAQRNPAPEKGQGQGQVSRVQHVVFQRAQGHHTNEQEVEVVPAGGEHQTTTQKHAIRGLVKVLAGCVDACTRQQERKEV